MAAVGGPGEEGDPASPNTLKRHAAFRSYIPHLEDSDAKKGAAVTAGIAFFQLGLDFKGGEVASYHHGGVHGRGRREERSAWRPGDGLTLALTYLVDSEQGSTCQTSKQF
ncbi:hypothetical protein EYF80_016630 [Liparis tanakae]|uniref:Uncharacterized protein n=1 Tax=Liparis tanakae TaxID=230148 RepID=A0A4Z2I751_9TELE|nr:hypothetical protein EYF80_016630 [Liparis tanakae]